MSSNRFPFRIAIVGCDGCGKSTQLRTLKGFLEEGGHSVAIDDKWSVLDRQYSPECRFIRSELSILQDCIAEMKEGSRLLFLFWLLTTSAKKAINDGSVTVVLHDGYWAKHACAELVHGASFALVNELQKLLPVPHLTILLDAPPSVTFERKSRNNEITAYECGRDKTRSKKSFIDHQTLVREKLLEIGSENKWTIVDADVSQSSLTENIKALVGQSLDRYMSNVEKIMKIGNEL